MQSSISLSDLSANGFSSGKIFTEFFKSIRQLKTEQDILTAGVDIVHRQLKCDRAVVYSLQSNSYCKIVAEAVTPGYTQTLDTTIKDPCFEAGYIEKYSRGRVRAITDIYKSNINPCHIESLEKIEVKSNLVVPIVRHDKSLYGLLVMHQCSQTRQWHQSEVEFVLQVASWMIEGIFQQQEQLALESKVKNIEREREIINSVAVKIHRAQTGLEVLQQGVNQAKEILRCDRVVAYSLQNKSMGRIVSEAAEPSLASILGKVIKDPCFEYRYIEQYQQGRVRAIPNIHEAGMTDCYVDNLAKIGVKSNLVAPINWDHGKIFGLLVAHQCFEFKDWQPEEIKHFQDIAFHTGLALSKARIAEQSQNIKMGVQQWNHVRDTINLAKSKINQIQQPMQHTGKILLEVHNLNKLLEREMSQIEQNSSTQTKKDIKLVQIIVRKLISITSKLRNSLSTVDTYGNEAELFLAEAVSRIDGNQSTSNEPK